MTSVRSIETEKKRVLILTDRYPPDVVGGAELSLSLTLRSLVKDFEMEVVALTDSSAQFTNDIQDDIRVWRNPFKDEWLPNKGLFVDLVTQSRRFPIRQIRRVDKFIVYLKTSASLHSFFDGLSALKLYYALREKNLLRWLPMRDEHRLLNNKDAIKRLQGIVREFDPDLIHADNYRSILLASSLNTTTPIIAHIRDNRFHCVRQDQPTNIDGVACVSCELGCVSALNSSVREDVGYMMRDDQFVRGRALEKASMVVTTSKFLEKQIRALHPNKLINVVPNPSDDIRYIDAVQKDIQQANPPEILIVGMLNGNKGQRRASHWISQLAETLPDFRLVLAGKGQMAEAIMREVRQLQLMDRLVLTGFLSREEIYRAYARASVVLAPNIWPGPFGRDVLLLPMLWAAWWKRYVIAKLEYLSILEMKNL